MHTILSHNIAKYLRIHANIVNFERIIGNMKNNSINCSPLANAHDSRILLQPLLFRNRFSCIGNEIRSEAKCGVKCGQIDKKTDNFCTVAKKCNKMAQYRLNWLYVIYFCARWMCPSRFGRCFHLLCDSTVVKGHC